MSDSAAADEDSADAGAARGGDGKAFARLIRRHEAAVAARMWRFTRDPGAHADLVQEVFVAAYQGLGGYRASGPFAHWLAVIAVRAGYAYWRARARRPDALDETAARRLAESPPPGTAAAEAGELVHRALACLPPRDRLVLTLLYLEGRTVAEAAELTGWSRVMVKVQAWRARAKLRKALETEDER
ncbi:MAG: hypothetical protein A2X36_15450 [Elusimicrobia bacterium GWA2_69_24]|nr:MAG: hypothetical protein A2X36_15450 [Elusimicrobia bacterium GWA2_69_24]